MHARRNGIVLALAAAAALATSDARVIADSPAPIPPVNDLPNPYQTISGFFKLPAGRTWGSTSAVEIDKDGKSIWVAERCGSNSCLDAATNEIKNIPTILKFDANGNLVKAFGEGMLIFPHGIHVDRDGNVWVTDGQDNAPRPARGGGPGAGAGAGAATGGGAAAGGGRAAGGGAPAGGGAAAAGAAAGGGRGTPQVQHPNPAATKGHQVFKFSPDGKLLLTLGRPGGGEAGTNPDYFFQPNDVITSPDGNFIFVSEGHGSTPGQNARVLKFDKNGKFIKSWGKWGSGDGEFDQPHALAFDSRGRLFVGDRNNNRIQIFDQDGKFLDKWYQFSRPSGVYIDKNDMIYVADSESQSVSRNHQDWKRGIRIGSAKDGKVMYFIPDPDLNATNTSAAEGVVVDAAGNVYGAEVGPRAVKKYTKK